MDKADGLAQARQSLADYLRLNSLRSTPERMALLEALYLYEAPFQAEELSREMADRGRFRISRATVYNNLRLFEDAGIVRKVYRDDKVLFERTDKTKGVIRLVCDVCGKITEMNSDKVRRKVSQLRTPRFSSTGGVLTMYGSSRCPSRRCSPPD